MLTHSLTLISRLLNHSAGYFSVSFSQDPLHIDLPPIGAGGVAGDSLITAEFLNVLASLYFQSELEQATVIPLAEILVESRYSLQLRDQEAAQMMEDFAAKMQSQWLNREIRNQVFARVFGAGVLDQPGMQVNRNYEPLMARMCSSFEQYERRSQFGTPSTQSLVQLEISIQALLQNLSTQSFGSVFNVSQRIQEQLQASLDLLNHAAVTQLFEARDIWGLIRNVLHEEAPDLQRLITRAQNGLRLLAWLAGNFDRLSGSALNGLISQSRGPFLWSANWLQATGVSTAAPDQGLTNPDYTQGPSMSGFGSVFSATDVLRQYDRQIVA